MRTGDGDATTEREDMLANQQLREKIQNSMLMEKQQHRRAKGGASCRQ